MRQTLHRRFYPQLALSAKDAGKDYSFDLRVIDMNVHAYIALLKSQNRQKTL